MKNYPNIFFALAIAALNFLPLLVFSQNNWCGERAMDQKYRNEHPQELPSILAAEKQLNDAAELMETQRGPRSNNVIPVVFHVIHLNGTENISELQVNDQVRILNEDYNAQNADLSEVVSSFTNVIGNASIEFRLARLDPSGNPTNGIDRIQSSKTNLGGDQAKLNPWPRNKYLNIWVVKQWNSSIPSGVLAYAYLPSSVQGSPNVDGIIVLSKYVGSIGTSSPSYARTLTHEIGHFLNLSHTWGSTNSPGMSTNCNDDDGVSDTPNCIGTFSCNLSSNSCGTLDNVQNQMDYASCPVMFTNGQASRMNSTLSTNVSQRNQLSTQSNLNATGVGQLTEANFVSNKVTFCQGESADFSDKSKYDASSWDWTFPNGQANNSTSSSPTVTYINPGLFDVTLSASSSSGTESVTKVGYIMVNPVIGNFVPYTDDFSSVSTLNHKNWYSSNLNDDPYYFEADSNNGYNGVRCLKMKNFGNQIVTDDELVTTTYDLSIFSSVSVSFKTAYAQTANSDLSKLTMYISTDCGETWTPRWASTGSNLASAPKTTSAFTPLGIQDWKSRSVPNITGSSLQQHAQFKFVFTNKVGNNLYFDDFQITGIYTTTAQLKHPEDGRVSLPNNQIIYWKAIGNIDSYEYQLDNTNTFTSSNLQTGINTAISIHEGPDTQFEPSGLTNGETYFWRVRLIKSGTPQSWSDTWSFTVADNGVSTQDILIEKYDVKVYPNPMKENGIVSFTLNQGAEVTVSVLDLMGKEQLKINSSFLGVGSHVFNIQNPHLAVGVYVIRINVGGEIIYKKISIN